MSIVFYVKCRLVLFKINMYTRAIYVHTFNSICRETNICPCHPLPSIQQAAGNYVNMNLEHNAQWHPGTTCCWGTKLGFLYLSLATIKCFDFGLIMDFPSLYYCFLGKVDKLLLFRLSNPTGASMRVCARWSLEVQTKVHPKVRNHGEGPY